MRLAHQGCRRSHTTSADTLARAPPDRARAPPGRARAPPNLDHEALQNEIGPNTRKPVAIALACPIASRQTVLPNLSLEVNAAIATAAEVQVTLRQNPAGNAEVVAATVLASAIGVNSDPLLRQAATPDVNADPSLRWVAMFFLLVRAAMPFPLGRAAIPILLPLLLSDHAPHDQPRQDV